jgi:hypothetical protein
MAEKDRVATLRFKSDGKKSGPRVTSFLLYCHVNPEASPTAAAMVTHKRIGPTTIDHLHALRASCNIEQTDRQTDKEGGK